MRRTAGAVGRCVQWVVTGYALAFGSLLLFGGRLSDLIGRRPMFIVGLLGFAAASAAGGAAQSFELLVSARVAQGVFGAVLAPAALSLLTVTFTDAAERARAFAIFGAIGGGGGAVGLMLGGALTEYLSWRWCLYVNIFFALVAVLGALILLKPQARPEDAKGIDVPGTLVVIAGLVSLVYGLASAEANGWSSATTLVCIVLGLALLAVFAVIENRVREPLLSMHILWDRTRGGSFLALSIIGIGMFAVFLFLTYYVSLTLGYTPVRTGSSFVPMIMAVILAATGSSGLVARMGPRVPIFAGLLLAAVGMVLLAQLELTSSYATDILPGLVITGLGIGLSVAPALGAATSGVEPEHSGVASALVNTVQQIGGSVGIAVLSAFAATAASDYLHGKPATAANQAFAALHSYTTVFWWAAGLFAVGPSCAARSCEVDLSRLIPTPPQLSLTSETPRRVHRHRAPQRRKTQFTRFRALAWRRLRLLRRFREVVLLAGLWHSADVATERRREWPLSGPI